MTTYLVFNNFPFWLIEGDCELSVRNISVDDLFTSDKKIVPLINTPEEFQLFSIFQAKFGTLDIGIPLVKNKDINLKDGGKIIVALFAGLASKGFSIRGDIDIDNCSIHLKKLTKFEVDIPY
ncbi:hypothetical protein [Okeania sp. SIO1I7]|uniref:hypothetical protein n=1 Tax=Okeania sp. SIO1I7 TaxID=2607772 RepID=UPI0013F72694|nr:hypothetical protein [Okeania sp. SIO1I7]NET29515.1 hypothetical protein [Okeania sp. SIO1I7]